MFKKKGEFIQRDLSDCGVCCLSSIIDFYDGFVPLEKLREDTYTTEKGTTFYHLLKAASKYGFEGYGTTYNLDNLNKQEIRLPAIAHVVLKNGLSHFVVVYKVNDKMIIIMDPSIGYKKLSVSEFLKIYTGSILVLIPIVKPLKLEKDKSLYDLFLRILPTEKKLIFKLIITSLCLISLNILSSFYLKYILDEKTLSQSTHYISFIALLFSFIYISKVILDFIRDNLENHLNKNINLRIVFPFLKHIIFLPLNFIKSRTTGEILTRINDLNEIKNLLSRIFITLTVDLLLAFSTVWFLVIISKELFGILFIVILFYGLVNVFLTKPFYYKIIANIDKETNLNSKMLEYIEGNLALKNIHNYPYVLKKVEKSYCDFTYDSFLFTKFINRIRFISSFIEEIGLFIVTTYGVFQVVNNNLNILSLITFNTLLFYFLNPIKNLINTYPQMIHLKANIAKISEFSSIKEEEFLSQKENIIGKIEIKNLTYSYDSINKNLNNVSFVIEPFDKVFLKGPSGSGKSTICRLLYGLISADNGKIFYDDINIENYSLDTIRKNITYLSQKEDLFSDTLKNNLVFGRNISLTKLNKIINLCFINRIVDNKTMELNAHLIDKGYNLSGGEKQRITLARALLKDASIIILDEALSEVESEMENQILKNILKEFKDKTIIYISHRNNQKLFDKTIDLGDLNG